APEARFAHLDLRIEVTFFSGQQCSASIYIYAAAFEDEILSERLRSEEPFAQQPGGSLRDAPIFLPIGIYRPGIKVKMDDGAFRFFSIAADENRPAVSHPAAICRPAQEL